MCLSLVISHEQCADHPYNGGVFGGSGVREGSQLSEALHFGVVRAALCHFTT